MCEMKWDTEFENGVVWGS